VEAGDFVYSDEVLEYKDEQDNKWGGKGNVHRKREKNSYNNRFQKA